jgi:hypothetical protein
MLTCDNCNTAVPGYLVNTGEARCPGCGDKITAYAFPAIARVEQGQHPESLMELGHAGCFYHPGKKAVVPCGSCGRFLCALCDLELDGKHLCPACLETGKDAGKIASVEKERVNHDSLVLSMAILPVLIWPIVVITAPLTIYSTFRHWKKPLSLTRKSRWRFIAGSGIALLELAGIAVIAITLAAQ